MPHLVGEGVADGLSPLNVTARSLQSPALLLTEPPAARVPPQSFPADSLYLSQREHPSYLHGCGRRLPRGLVLPSCPRGHR